MEPGLESPDSDIEDDRGLGILQAEVVVDDQHRALLGRQSIKPVGQLVAHGDQVLGVVGARMTRDHIDLHDRAMLESLTSRVWVLHEHHITDFPGSFAEWEEQSREREHAASVAAAEQEALRRVRERKTTRRQETKGEELKAVLRDSRQKVEKCEKEVATLERKVAELTALLEDPELYTTRDGTQKSLVAGKELDDARRQLDEAIERWTAATERAEQLSSR